LRMGVEIDWARREVWGSKVVEMRDVYDVVLYDKRCTLKTRVPEIVR